MGRYLGPKLRIVRRLGPLPGLTGRGQGISERPKPGQHGKINKKTTKYGIRLEEKQRLRFNYGISETQFFNYVKIVRKSKSKAKNPISQTLEMRLDSIIFSIGFAPTIAAARQLVSHRHIVVKRQNHTPTEEPHQRKEGNPQNQQTSQPWKIVSIPSFLCHKGDIISVKDSAVSVGLVARGLEISRPEQSPQHIKCTNRKSKNPTLEAEILKLSDGFVFTAKELLIMEHYSRKL